MTLLSSCIAILPPASLPRREIEDGLAPAYATQGPPTSHIQRTVVRAGWHMRPGQLVTPISCSSASHAVALRFSCLRSYCMPRRRSWRKSRTPPQKTILLIVHQHCPIQPTSARLTCDVDSTWAYIPEGHKDLHWDFLSTHGRLWTNYQLT
jgi:hypothetical protein